MSCVDNSTLDGSVADIDVLRHGRRKRSSQESLPQEDIPWTAARCNRLLRTITSRIAILRKLSKSNAEDNDSHDRALSTPTARSRFRVGISAKIVPKVDTPGRDPLWLRATSSGAVKRTYSGRVKSWRQSPERKKLSNRKLKAVDAIHFPTPFLKRTFSGLRQNAADFATASNDSCVASWSKPAFNGRTKCKQPVKPTCYREETLRSLVSAFEAMLLVTQSSAQSFRVGSRSLMGTCLRKVPDYIAVESAWRKESGMPNSAETAGEVYQDLEVFGSSAAAGRAALAEVVRAHCVSTICEGVSEGLLSDSLCARMVTVCSRLEAFSAVEYILNAWRSWLYAKTSRHKEFKAGMTVLLSSLQYLDSIGDTTQLCFRQLRAVLQSGALPLPDLVDLLDFKRNGIITALTSSLNSDEVSAFLSESVLLCASSKDKSAQSKQTMSSLQGLLSGLVTLLTAMALIQDRRGQMCQNVNLVELLHRMSSTLLLRAEQVKRVEPATRSLSSPLIYASSILLRASGLHASPALVSPSTEHLLRLSRIETNQGAKLLYESGPAPIAEFACNVAHCASRASGAGTFSLRRSLVHGFLALAESTTDSTRVQLTGLAMEFARLFADHLEDREQSAFMTEIQQAVKQATSINLTMPLTETPSGKFNNAGFRWEEDICEWIAATPLTVSQDFTLMAPINESTTLAWLQSPTNQPVGKPLEVEVPIAKGVGLTERLTPPQSNVVRKVASAPPSPDVLAPSSPSVRTAVTLGNIDDLQTRRKKLKRHFYDTAGSDPEATNLKRRYLNPEPRRELSNKENLPPSGLTAADRINCGWRKLDLSVQKRRAVRHGKLLALGERVAGPSGRTLRRVQSDVVRGTLEDASDDELGM